MPDHNSLAKQALKGDYEAFEQLVDHHKDKVYRTCLLLLGSVPEGLEAAEQVFVAAYRSLHKTEEKAVSDWIYRLAETRASGLRNELQRRGFQQRQGRADTPKISDELKAPPGFTAAVRERLRLEADLVRKAASRRRSRSIAVGVAAASASVLAGLAIYHYIPRVPGQGQENTSQLSATPAPPVTEAFVATSTLPAPSTTVPPATPAPPMPRDSLPAIKEPKPGHLPQIVISRPRNDDSSPDKIFRSIYPPLKSSPARDGNTWVVELTDDQFWSMHSLLKVSYAKMRIPESAIPQGRSLTRIALKLIPAAPAHGKAALAGEEAQTDIDTRSRLPVEDLLKE